MIASQSARPRSPKFSLTLSPTLALASPPVQSTLRPTSCELPFETHPKQFPTPSSSSTTSQATFPLVTPLQGTAWTPASTQSSMWSSVTPSRQHFLQATSSLQALLFSSPEEGDIFLLLFLNGSHVAEADLDLIYMQPSMSSMLVNFYSSCFHLPGAGITGVCWHTKFMYGGDRTQGSVHARQALYQLR